MAANHRNDLPPRRALHPPLVHAPIGGVVIAALCDLVSVVGGASHSWAHTWFKGGSYALSVGTSVLLVAAVAGFVDRARHTAARSRERGAVNKHAAVMTLMAIVCVLDLLVRSTRYDSAQHAPVVVVVLTLVALALAAAGGALGGRLVYHAGIGVQPRAPAKVSSRDGPAIAGGPIDQRPATTRTG
jgi:uncharacterized membrane protein